ncbi:MAG: HEPN domain-containing protein [Deltaproteobacteria bacterium]|nr:HEPN domain-containing protein [Deltaproteobacteria bacterium]
MAGSVIPGELLRHVVERTRPEQVWVFGSRARGDATTTSDWDLLLVLPDDSSDDSLDQAKAWDTCARDAPEPVDIVPVRRGEFETMRRFAGSLCRTVALEGVQVYGERVAPSPIALGYLAAADEDLDAARRLSVPPINRLAAYHLQQAAEKLAKAVLSARGTHTTKEHRIGELVGQLAIGEPWRTKLGALAHLDRFATADLGTLAELLAEARGEAGIGR